jgi:hypothetical protein
MLHTALGDAHRDLTLGDVGEFGAESGQKYVICKISSRNYVFGREGDKSPKSLTNEGKGIVKSVKKLGNIDNKTMMSTSY